MRKTKVINLYGGPSIGKSVLAARLYGEMACNPTIGCVEQVNEYAKLLVWKKHHETLSHQPTVTQGQIGHFAAIGQCDFIVTDSPIDLGLIYASTEHLEETRTLIEEFKLDNPHSEINILLKRERKGFQEVGKVHDESESIKKDQEVKDMLIDLEKDFIEVSNMIDPAELSRIILQDYA